MNIRDFAVGIELPEDGEYKCTQIEMFENDIVAVYLSTLDGKKEVKALMIPENSNYFEFIDQKVTVCFRNERINGQYVVYINNFTRVEEVAVIPTQGIFKLYLDEPAKIGTNVRFQDLNIGKEYKSLKLYCIKNIYNASPKTYWSEYRLMDENRKIITGRCFHPISDSPDHSGKYISADVVRTKFGLNLDNIRPLNKESVAVNPLVKIAKRYILTQMNDFSETTKTCLEKSDLINYLENRCPDEDLEIGFDLVKIAITLSLIEPYTNISKTLDARSMKEAAVLLHLYKLNYDKKLSITVNSVLSLARYGALKNKKLINLITDKAEEISLEKRLLEQIIATTDMALEATISEV